MAGTINQTPNKEMTAMKHTILERDDESITQIPHRASASRLSGFLTFNSFRTLLLICAGLMVLFFVAQVARFLPVSSDNVYPESAGVLTAQRWAQGGALYGDYRQPPYLMTPFTPLWYGLLAIAAKAGVQSLDSLALFGRLLSLISLCGIALLGYLWNRRLGLTSGLALFTPVFYLSFPILIPWAVTARPDLPAVFLGFLAMYFLKQQPTTSSVTMAGAVAALAFLMRHNAVAVPVAVVLWLFWSKRWKYAIIFSAAWGIVAASVLVPVVWSTHGLVLINLSGAKFGQFALTYIRDVLNQLLVREGSGLAIGLFALGAFGCIVTLGQAERSTQLIRIYLAVSFALAAISSAAAGAAVNYYLEPALALAILVPAGLARLQNGWEDGSPFAVLAFLLTLAIILPSLDVQRWKAMHNQPENLRQFLSLAQSRHVFTDEPYLAARLASPQAIDLASLTNTERTHGKAAWSSAAIAQELRTRNYELVILRTPMAPPYVPYNPAANYPRAPRLDSALQAAIMHNYRLCFEWDRLDGYGPVFVYAPLPAATNSVAENCPSSQPFSGAKSQLQPSSGN